MITILMHLTHEQLRDLATVHNIPCGRNRNETMFNISRYIDHLDVPTLKEILTYILGYI